MNDNPYALYIIASLYAAVYSRTQITQRNIRVNPEHDMVCLFSCVTKHRLFGV